MISVGLGQAEGMDTESVVKSAISNCAAHMAGCMPQVGIVFAGVHFDHRLMLDLISQAFPGMQLIGCTTAGDFSSAYGFSDDSISLMTIASEEIEFRTGVGRGLSLDHAAAVREAVENAHNKADQAPGLCLIFPATLSVESTAALKALHAQLGEYCPIFGGGSGTHEIDESPILQFHGREVLTDALPILLMFGPVEHRYAIAHSWRPLGKKAIVTKARGRIAHKIGDISAVDFYRRYLGHHEEPAREFILAVYERGSDDYYLRAPMDYRLDGSIVFSESIPEGAEVQLTEAVRGDLIRNTVTTTKRLNDSARDWEPAFALAFSCAFRKGILGTQAQTELQILKENLPSNLPIAGFYSFGEISPLTPGGSSVAHGATLVTLLVGPGSSDMAPHTLGASELQEAESPEQDCAFIRRKLQRSEAYRQHLESLKDFSSRMHLQIMTEIDEARQELQQKEAALRSSEEKFRRIVQTAAEGFVLIDETLAIVDTNDAFCQMLGYTQTEVVGKSFLDLATEEFRQYLDSNCQELMAKTYRRVEGAIIARDGRHVPVLMHGSTLRNDQGEIIGNMAFITDMTEHKNALALAGEVQKSLLPQENPSVPGLDVAGRNVSCEEVGGDYYDFFWQQGPSHKAFSVAVGDVAGHGVDAALLMSSARASLRVHASQTESIADIVKAMNRQLAEDVMGTGRFMTLFYLTIEPELNGLQWVCAGHDPAIVYDPATDAFEDLEGTGIPLGIDRQFSYQSQRKTKLRSGQVIAIGTDGIWEFWSRDRELFGKDRFKALLRQYAAYPAAQILNEIYAGLKDFGKGRRPTDDITLVIIKIQKEEP